MPVARISASKYWQMRTYRARFPCEDARLKVRPLGEWSNAASQTAATRAQYCQEVQGNARGLRALPTMEITETMFRNKLFQGVWTFPMSDGLRNTILVHMGGP